MALVRQFLGTMAADQSHEVARSVLVMLDALGSAAELLMLLYQLLASVRVQDTS